MILGVCIASVLFYFTTYMHHRAEYRIRGQKKTEDDFDEQIEQQLKLSTHAKGQRRENSAMLSRKHQESSQNSRLADSRANSRIGSSVIGSRVGRVLRNSRTDKNGVVDIQFNNVRWISIVSAYDSKRLKNVTVSKQSCETFLKRYGTGIKNDAAAMALFKDIKRHFHSWLGRINEAFSDVIDDFLRVSERAPLQNFKQMEPILESISKDTYMMGQKLQGCLKIYENNDFRKLFTRFQNFNVFSSKLEDLIKGIYQSKHRIDQLFSELENVEDEKVVDKKVDKIIKKGVREAESIIDDVNGYNNSIRDRIISKVRLAINDMADKSLSLFHKVQGAKDLIRRLHKLITDSRRSLQSSQIRKISKIFKAIIEQANKFQDFVIHFNAEQDHISPKLREKLNEYSDNIEQQKKAVSEIQMLFVQTVINQTIQALKSSFTLNNVLSPTQQKIQYNEFNHTLQQISDAMLDQTSRGCVEGLIKHGKSNFSKLDDQLEKIKRIFRKNQGIIFIDTENGQIQIMEYCNLADKYKTKIRNLIHKHEEALRNLGIYYRQARLSDNEKDPELLYLKDIRKVVEVVNGKQRSDGFIKVKGFSQLNNSGNILEYGTEVAQAFNLMQQMQGNKKQTTNFNQTNPLKNLIKNIRFDNQLYLEAAYILQCYDIINKTNQRNLIQNLTKLTEINSKRNHQLKDDDGYRTTKPYCHLLDRLYCLCLIKGLKKPTIKQFDDNKAIVFPETEYDAKQMQNEIKYRTLIAETIGDGGNYSKNKIKAALKVMKDMISSFRIIEKLNNNSNGEYIILVQTLSAFSVQYFKILISNDELNERGVECKKIILQCVRSLKAKLSNIDLVDQQIDMETVDAALKARNKILKIQALNQKALVSLQQTSKKNDYMEIFSAFVFTLTEYIEQSKQLVYIALNEFKQPIWFNSISSAKDGIAAQIDLKGYRRGTFVDQYAREAPIVRKVVQTEKNVKSPTKSPEGKEKNFIVRQKSHQKQAMDEEMAIESDKQMDEDIDNNIEEVNIQEINDDMVQQMNDYVDDNMEEEINEFEEGVQEIDDNMAEDIDEEVIQSMSPHKHKNKSKETAKVASKKQMEVQRPKIESKKSPQVSVYEIIPHFRQLQQIRTMFLLIDTTQSVFWSSQVDYDELQDFFHRAEDLKDTSNFIKSLESCFSMFINSRFEKGISDQIKKLDRFTSLKQMFNNLGQKSWIILFKVLSSIDFSYSLLLANKSQRQQIIQIKISRKNNGSFKKQGSRLILENFLARTFKSSFYKAEKFNIDEYLSNCFKVEAQQCLNTAGDGFHYVIKVIPQYKETLPEGQTHTQMLNLQKIQQTFCTNLVTGIDLRALLIQIWVKAIAPDAEEYYKPDYSTLNRYIKTLDYVDKKEWIGHYLIDFRQSILKIRDKIKSHKNLIDNTLFKIDSTNVWQCINNISELYQKKIRQKTAYITTKQECIVYAICEDSAIGVTSESKLSTFLQDLFNRSDKKQPKVIITQQQIVNIIGKQYEKDENSFQMHESITNLLNIMEIQHFYATQPEIIFKSNLDEVVFCVLKNLNVKGKQQIDYQNIFKDLFDHKKDKFSNILSLKKKIDRKIFTDAHIKQINSRLKDIAKQSKKNQQNFKTTIINSQMSLVLFDSLQNKLSKPQQAIKEYYSWLKFIEEQLSSQLTSKLFNLLNYVTEKKRQITNLQQSISKSIIEIEPLTKCRNLSSKNTKIIEQVGSLLRSVSKWMTQKGYASNCSLFSIKTDQNSWIFSLQFANKDPQQYLRQYFTKHILANNDNKRENQKLFTQFYKNSIESKVKVNNNDKFIEVNYEISKVPLELTRQIREDLVEIDDMLAFTRYYNQHRFNTSATILKKLEETHTKLIKKMKSKLFLVQLKELISKCRWNGLQKLQIFKQLFECFSGQLNYQKEHLWKVIEQTEQIGVRETDLKSYIDWFKQLGINELKMTYYILKSSQKSIITIFPVAKIEKDKSKSSQDIKKFLADIKLPPKYTVALEQGVSTINLQKEVIKCRLNDNEHFLTEQSQLNNFDPSIPEGQILLLSYYQGASENEKTPLMIGELKVETQCILNIKQYETSSTITCSIWKIAKSDYEQWKSNHQKPEEESFRQLRKKMRGLATSQQKIRDVCVGQDVNFTETGAWLREELKKHNKRVQQQKRAEQERKRIEALTIAESQHFLATVYQDMVNKESLPTLKMTLDQAKKLKAENVSQPNDPLTGYWKKILDSNKKVIEKMQQSKSSEEINRINALTKDYVKFVKMKLVQNQHIQAQMMKSANEEFATVEKQREIKQEQKRKERQQRIELKKKEKEEKLKKKLAQQAKKLLKVAAQNETSIPDMVDPSAAFGQEVKKPEPSQVIQVKAIQQSEEEPEPKVEEEQIDECELILEFDGFEQIKKGKEEELYMSYLIFLLESQSKKDAQYYRCILRSFWKQTHKNRESLVLLK